jgi:hypothetical protein
VFDVTLTDNFQYQSQFLRMRVTNWHTIFVDQGQFGDPDFISGRENVQMDAKQNIIQNHRSLKTK